MAPQYNNVNAALKQHLISSISNIYIRTLHDRHTGFANVSIRELIDWRKLPAIGKTWATFKIDFAEAYCDFRLSQATTQTKGFHGANNTIDSFVTDTAVAFANLATVTASDRKLMVDLAASNQTLLAQLSSKDRDISKLQAQLATRNTRSSSSRDGSSRPRPRRYHNTNYCWTHGWDVHESHTSSTCNHQADGHKTSATRSSTTGGTDSNKNKAA
jgi:hypothetical protein